MDRPREAISVLSRLLALEPGFSVKQAVQRSPWSRPEDTARYADGLRRAGLSEDDGLRGADQATLKLQHTLIDLAPEPPHSPIFGTERSK
jgi:hypothetical protein